MPGPNDSAVILSLIQGARERWTNKGEGLGAFGTYVEWVAAYVASTETHEARTVLGTVVPDLVEFVSQRPWMADGIQLIRGRAGETLEYIQVIPDLTEALAETPEGAKLLVALAVHAAAENDLVGLIAAGQGGAGGDKVVRRVNECLAYIRSKAAETEPSRAQLTVLTTVKQHLASTVKWQGKRLLNTYRTEPEALEHAVNLLDSMPDFVDELTSTSKAATRFVDGLFTLSDPGLDL